MTSSDETQPTPSARSADEIHAWLIDKLAEAKGIDRGEISSSEPLIGMGLDSMQFVVLVGELEQWLDCRFSDNPLMDYPTIDSLSEFLADQLSKGNTLIDPTVRSSGV